MESFRIGEMKEVLKTLLKKKKQTYADLALHLNCSEPTVKRILGNEELTLTRLLQICDFLNVSLGEIEGMIQKGGREEFHLSEKQQKFLVQNKNHFAYLMEIYQGLSAEQISEKYKLTTKSTQKYLINLEKHDLIKVNKNNVKPFNKSFPSLKNGPLGIAFYKSIIQNSSAFFIDHVSEQIALRNDAKPDSGRAGASYSVQSMVVSVETFRLAVKEIESRLYELERTASFEEKNLAQDKLKSGVIILASAVVDQKYKGLDTIQRSFGEIINL